MKRMWHIIVREYLENVRTKAFIIGIVLTPLWFGLVFLVPLLAEGQKVATQRVVIVDKTEDLAGEVRAGLESVNSGQERAAYEVETHLGTAAFDRHFGESSLVERLRMQAAKGELVLVVLGDAVLEKRADESVGIFHAASAGVHEAAVGIQRIVDGVVNQRFMEARGIRPEDARLLQRKSIETVPLSRGGAEGGVAQFLTPLVFMVFLFMGIVGISQMLVNSTIEEKSSRVYEVLLSSVSPFQLMAGKVFGICAVGFTLLAFWVGGSLLAATIQGIEGIVTGRLLGLFVAYYVLGFLLIASLFVAVGSACNTLKEAQNLMAPLSMLLALPLLSAILILKSPNGAFATVTSFIPPFTPFVMMIRVAGVPEPPAWQIWASLLLLVLCTWLAIRLAARVFRVGILMYGKPPRLSEIWHWVFRS